MALNTERELSRGDMVAGIRNVADNKMVPNNVDRSDIWNMSFLIPMLDDESL